MTWVSLVAGNVPSLIGFAILTWFLAGQLRKCVEARDALAVEHTRMYERIADLRVRIAVLESRNDNAAVVAMERNADG